MPSPWQRSRLQLPRSTKLRVKIPVRDTEMAKRKEVEVTSSNVAADRSIPVVDLAVLRETVAHHTETIKQHTSEIKDMARKVFNGFGDKITSLEEKMDTEILDNASDHAALGRSIDSVKKSVGKLLWFVAMALVMIFVALVSILGSIWISDRNAMQRSVIDPPVIEVENATNDQGT